MRIPSPVGAAGAFSATAFSGAGAAACSTLDSVRGRAAAGRGDSALAAWPSFTSTRCVVDGSIDSTCVGRLGWLKISSYLRDGSSAVATGVVPMNVVLPRSTSVTVAPAGDDTSTTSTNFDGTAAGLGAGSAAFTAGA